MGSLIVDGSKSSCYWNQENGDRLWRGFRSGGNMEVMRDPNETDPSIRMPGALAAGHPEGWNDTQRDAIRAVYDFIREGKVVGRDKVDFATFDDGHQNARLVEAILESNASRCWVSLR